MSDDRPPLVRGVVEALKEMYSEAQCPACGRIGRKERKNPTAFTCPNNECDVWWFGREVRGLTECDSN